MTGRLHGAELSTKSRDRAMAEGYRALAVRSGAVPWSVIALGVALTACSTVSSAAPPPSSPVTIELHAVLPTTSLAVPSTTSVPPETTHVDPVEGIAPRPALRLVFTGDILMHSPLWRQATRNGNGVPDFAPMFDHVEPLVQRADLAVCHLETPIAPAGEQWTTDPRYGVPAEVVDAIAATGFDHCSTASNHTFDRGMAGVQATIDRLAAMGITQHGMAATPADNEPMLIDVDGVVIGHLSATYGFDVGVRPRDEPWRTSLIDPTRLIADARLARERGAELVVASLHWGSSGSHQASEQQRRIALELADSGAIDLVVGHHAHVVQPIERIGNMWVAYGLGNLISNMPTGDPVWDESTRDGILLEVEVLRDLRTRPSIGAIVAHPVWVDHDAGWVIRDVGAARQDPELVGRIGAALDESWARTASVVGAHVPTS